MKYLLALLILVPNIVYGQSWLASGILAKTSAVRVSLRANIDGNIQTVATIERVWVERAVSITQRLAKQYDMPLPMVYLTHSKSPNAFVTFNKQRQSVMALNTAMLSLVGHDEDLMAAVIGHELGHLKANHLTEGAAAQTFVRLIGILAGATYDVNQAKRGRDTQGAGRQVGALGGDLISAKFNRDQEREADELGIQAMTGAGFSATASPRLWRMMANMGGGGSGFWLDSHPSHTERERSLQLAASNLQPAYSQSAASTAPVQVSSIELPYVSDPWPTSPFKTFALTAPELAATEPGNYRKYIEAFRSGQFELAMEALKASADDDLDERAMARLYGFFLTGKHVPKDDVRAREYAELSATKGFAPGIYALGDATLRKLGSAPFDLQASEIFTLAHQRGLPTATYRLALLHLSGQGGANRDALKARQLAQLSAERNDARGKSLYGAFLRDGVGGPADPMRGFQLIKEAVAAAPSNGFANLQLGIAYERGVGTNADRQAALEAYRKASAAGMQQAKDRLKALIGE